MSQENPTATGAGMKRWRAWRSRWRSVWLSPRRLHFWLLMALALYTLAGFFLLPWLIERGAVKALSEVDRSLRLGAVKVNPFVLDMELKDVELRDTDGEMLFACDDFYLNFQLSSLFHRAWVFRELRLLKPYFNLERYRSGEDRIGNLVAAFASDDAVGKRSRPQRPVCRGCSSTTWNCRKAKWRSPTISRTRNSALSLARSR
jgi:hypothetical protein